MRLITKSHVLYHFKQAPLHYLFYGRSIIRMYINVHNPLFQQRRHGIVSIVIHSALKMYGPTSEFCRYFLWFIFALIFNKSVNNDYFIIYH